MADGVRQEDRKREYAAIAMASERELTTETKLNSHFTIKLYGSDYMTRQIKRAREKHERFTEI